MCARISILADAVNYSLYRVVPRLLSKGAKPRKAATAAAAGDIEFFETTSALHGETINEINLAEDDSGSTYLMVACRAGNNTFVDYLLDKCVAMPLHHAVLLPCLPLLPWHTASDRLQHCSPHAALSALPHPLRYSDDIVADVLNRDTGESALITAARHGHVHIVKKLIQWYVTGIPFEPSMTTCRPCF